MAARCPAWQVCPNTVEKFGGQQQKQPARTATENAHHPPARPASLLPVTRWTNNAPSIVAIEKLTARARSRAVTTNNRPMHELRGQKQREIVIPILTAG